MSEIKFEFSNKIKNRCIEISSIKDNPNAKYKSEI